MINLERYISSDNYDTVGYFTRHHVDKDEFLDAVLKENDFGCELQLNDVKHEYWKIMSEEEMEHEGVGDDDLEEYFSLSDKLNPCSFPVTVIFLNQSYSVR